MSLTMAHKSRRCHRWGWHSPSRGNVGNLAHHPVHRALELLEDLEAAGNGFALAFHL